MDTVYGKLHCCESQNPTAGYSAAFYHVKFQAKYIHSDNRFQDIMDGLAMQLPNVILNFVNPQGHILEAEQNHRIPKERVWTAYVQLLYNYCQN